MTQFPHDQFAKDLLETLLSPFGEIQTAKTIDAQVREIDVYFTPTANIQTDTRLGLLHKLAATPATFEPCTPKNAGNHAKQIRRVVDNCTQHNSLDNFGEEEE